MDTLTPIHDEIKAIKSTLSADDVPMTQRERKDMETRLWDLEWSSWYCDARLAERRLTDPVQSR